MYVRKLNNKMTFFLCVLLNINFIFEDVLLRGEGYQHSIFCKLICFASSGLSAGDRLTVEDGEVA